MTESIYKYFNKKLTITVNWALITFYLIFFSYGFYGVISRDFNILFTIITIFNLCFFYFLGKKSNFKFEEKININYFDFFNFIIFFFLLIIINLSYLNLSLFPQHTRDSIDLVQSKIRSCPFLINFQKLIEKHYCI